MASFVLLLILVYFMCLRGDAQHEQQSLREEAKRPNILFILTDDQDVQLGSLSFMPYLKEHVIDRGLQFKRHYCTVALCCPSRVSLWTGKAARKLIWNIESAAYCDNWSPLTQVKTIRMSPIFILRMVSLFFLLCALRYRLSSMEDPQIRFSFLTIPAGGYPKFVSQGFNENYLPLWLQAAGYNTYYVGKLFNAQTITNYDSPHASGWTGSDFLLDPYTYRYLNSTFQRNHERPVSYEGHYATDVLAEKAYGFLQDAVDDLHRNGSPFFLTIAPTAPHSDVNIKRTNTHGDFDENTNVQSPPIPAERHKHLFEGEIVPRTPNFNPDHACGVSWISRLPKQNQTNVDYNDVWHRNRLRALQAVDEMVDSLVKRLDDAGILDNTYIFYSSDNGYTIGQHRRQPGKQCAFEQDINVPLIVRGPNIPGGTETSIVTSHTDLAPTFLQIAGAWAPDGFELDGQAIPLISEVAAKIGVLGSIWRQEHVNVEMWGIIMSEGKYGMVLYPNHTYKALRIESSDYSLLYTVWCSGGHELYAMGVSEVRLVPSLAAAVANKLARMIHTKLTIS
jgi:arylsulfatase A-like enzyme